MNKDGISGVGGGMRSPLRFDSGAHFDAEHGSGCEGGVSVVVWCWLWWSCWWRVRALSRSAAASSSTRAGSKSARPMVDASSVGRACEREWGGSPQVSAAPRQGWRGADEVRKSELRRLLEELHALKA